MFGDLKNTVLSILRLREAEKVLIVVPLECQVSLTVLFFILEYKLYLQIMLHQTFNLKCDPVVMLLFCLSLHLIHVNCQILKRKVLPDFFSYNSNDSVEVNFVCFISVLLSFLNMLHLVITDTNTLQRQNKIKSAKQPL